MNYCAVLNNQNEAPGKVTLRVLRVYILVIVQRMNWFGWHAADQSVGRDILSNHGAGRNHHVIPNRDPRHNGDFSSDLNIIANSNGSSLGQIPPPTRGRHGMIDRINIHVRPNHHVVANRYRGDI